MVGDRVVVLDAPYALDKASLLSGVAHALRCQAVRRIRYVGPDATKQVSIHLFGFDSDLARVELLFTSLLLQATSRLARTIARPTSPSPPTAGPGSPGSPERSRTGSGWPSPRPAGTPSRRATTGGRAVGGAGARGPIPRGGRRGGLEYPHLTSARRRQLSGSGGRSGWAAGERADLGGPRVSGRRGELAG